jgi:signal peptidase
MEVVEMLKFRSFVKKTVSVVASVVFYLVITAVLLGVVLNFVGVKPYIVMSGSMEPAIHTGSVCFVDTNVAYEDIALDDVVAYRPTLNGGFVTHRVIGIYDSGFETKGDANDVSDGISTTRESFYGKTLFSIPYIGFIIKYVQTPFGLASLGILVVIYMTYCAIKNNNGNKQGSNKE